MAIKEILEKLIGFKTVSKNPQESKKALQWVKAIVKNFPVFCREEENNGFPSLFISTQKTKAPQLILAAHIDVVPADDSLFKPQTKQGKLYGRGAFDMKFAVAMYLCFLEEFKDDLERLDLGIMLTADEELGGFNGTNYLLKKGYKGKVCFLPDGGENWTFQEKAKGVYQFFVKSQGKSAHSSRVWEGDNAISRLIRFLEKLERNFSQKSPQRRDHYYNTLNISQISGGDACNKVPRYAEALVDIRFIPETNIDKLKKYIKKLAQKEKVSIEERALGKGYKIERTNGYLKLFSQIAKQKFGVIPRYSFSHGSSDARFFDEHNIPTILIRPKGGGSHSQKEWIDIKDLERFYAVFKEFVLKVGRK